MTFDGYLRAQGGAEWQIQVFVPSLNFVPQMEVAVISFRLEDSWVNCICAVSNFGQLEDRLRGLCAHLRRNMLVLPPFGQNLTRWMEYSLEYSMPGIEIGGLTFFSHPTPPFSETNPPPPEYGLAYGEMFGLNVELMVISILLHPISKIYL